MINTKKRSNSGTRKDLGIYVRSTWEANYARYLNLAIERNYIRAWKYEVDEFQFHKIKKGTRFYRPDFKVWRINDPVEYHEVKGYMTQKSRTQLNRMRIYYPNVKIKLIDKAAYKEVDRKFSRFIPRWEFR